MQMRGVCYATIWSSSTVMLAGIDYSITAIISDSLFSKVVLADPHPQRIAVGICRSRCINFRTFTNPANLVLSP
jgi:hypothetical protein